MASIYEIPDYDPQDVWVKNEIAAGTSSEAGTTAGRFYYNLGYDDGDGNLNKSRPDTANGSAYWGGYITFDNKTIPHFFWTPSYSPSFNNEPTVRSVRFGDGYEQRTPEGINSNLLKVSLNFDKRDEKEATAIAHFLHARGGAESFAYLPPSPYSSMKKFVCRKWDVEMTFDNNYAIKVDLEEVVE